MATETDPNGGGVRITNREIYKISLETRDRTLEIARDVSDLKIQGAALSTTQVAQELRIRKVEELQDRAKSIRAFAGWLVSPVVILGAAFIGSRFR